MSQAEEEENFGTCTILKEMYPRPSEFKGQSAIHLNFEHFTKCWWQGVGTDIYTGIIIKCKFEPSRSNVKVKMQLQLHLH